jgi:glycosyltransferase involved in cell wall biosynthesis
MDSERGLTLRGSVDRASRQQIAGWAQDPARPDQPVSLLITVDGTLVARVLADRERADLRQAGIGQGRHGFDVVLHGLSPVERHVVAVWREEDGAPLAGTPILFTPSGQFDPDFAAYCATLLAAPTDEAGLVERLAFLTDQAELLLRQRAARRARLTERSALRHVKWQPTGPAETWPSRALVIDETMPATARDAGSNAVLSHMQALRRLGYEVDFVASDMARDGSATLQKAGIACCHAPWFGSVEDVLRRAPDGYDLVYLHRATIASRYLGLVRAHQPKARLVYNVADLHFLRYARQAAAEDRPELVTLARQFQATELRLAASADAVITHSTHEALLLRQHLPNANLHVVPWSVPSRDTCVPFAHRQGLAFIGHYGHPPNVDAAQWLITEIIPCLRRMLPSVTCLLAGSDMPDSLRRAAPGIEVVGQVDLLSDIFDRVRLTIAPMAYGAGVKGKVLDSLAAGIPCVCTPVAAEGLDLPPALQSLVASDAAGLAHAIARLHEDEALNQACREAGLAYVEAMLSETRVDTRLRAAVLPDLASTP